MGARVEPEKSKNFGCLAIEEKSGEMLHYAENAEVKISNLVNCGIYLFSTRIFTEYGLSPYPDDVHNSNNSNNEDNLGSSNVHTEGNSTPKE
jgi:NDP-sugar pyrophosphorylase family protein